MKILVMVVIPPLGVAGVAYGIAYDGARGIGGLGHRPRMARRACCGLCHQPVLVLSSGIQVQRQVSEGSGRGTSRHARRRCA